MASSTSRPAWHEPGRIARLWVGLLTGPVVWFALLEFNYAMSYVACESRTTWFLHTATLTSVVLIAGAAYVAWRAATPYPDRRHSPPATPETAESRRRWMAAAGVGLSLWFILVVLAMEIPILVLNTCQ